MVTPKSDKVFKELHNIVCWETSFLQVVSGLLVHLIFLPYEEIWFWDFSSQSEKKVLSREVCEVTHVLDN